MYYFKLNPTNMYNEICTELLWYGGQLKTLNNGLLWLHFVLNFTLERTIVLYNVPYLDGTLIAGLCYAESRVVQPLSHMAHITALTFPSMTFHISHYYTAKGFLPDFPEKAGFLISRFYFPGIKAKQIPLQNHQSHIDHSH